MIEKLLRWVGIKLLVRSCVDRAADWSEARKTYILHRGSFYVGLVGQQPGATYTAPGRYCFVLIGECLHHQIDRVALKRPGAFFTADGVLQVHPGPGVNWCWYLQIGR